MNEEFFKVSSGLKTLIGSELITDNFIAVFELVKNSFDARATQVEILFENLRTGTPRIVIADNGKGMNYDDLQDKWLFVAYSAKRDGTEDYSDYRDKIRFKNNYAGAKGVGRFSCDRLGRYLNLITIKDEPNSKIESVSIDWGKFELNQKDEFIKIPVGHEVLNSLPEKIKQSISFQVKCGTILEITGLDSSEWSRENLKKLKDRLSKLIRPDLNTSNKERKFNIKISVPEEIEEDQRLIEKARFKDEDEREGFIYRGTVNGDIHNVIFDELDIRTTKIEANISKDGKTISTKLTDRNDFIYEIKEHNNFDLLKDVSITVYFLNQSAKSIFKRRVGTEAVNFGNLFVYKNGFRINPYGDRGDDSFGLDNRAMQGYARYLGLRTIIGQIDVQGENTELRETTSRGGGFVKTIAYAQLANLDNGLLVRTLRRLEKFTSEVIQWGLTDDTINSLSSEESRQKLLKIISNIYDDKSLISLDYNKNLVDVLDQREEQSARKLVRNFKRLATESNDPQLLKDASRLEKGINAALRAKDSAESETQKEREEKNKVKEELEQQISETLFARAVVGTETKELLSIQHHINRHSAQHISLLLDKLIDSINKDASKEKLLDFVNQAILANKKVITLSRFVTKASFDTMTDKIKTDLITFVNQYAVNVYLEYKRSASNDQNIQIKTLTPPNLEFEFDFQPIEIVIILDNLLNNSFKAKAQKVDLIWEKSNPSELILHFVDDGKVKILDKNLDKIFEFRFSTTNGSGLGLYHTKQVLERMGGSISVNNKLEKGVEFILKFKK